MDFKERMWLHNKVQTNISLIIYSENKDQYSEVNQPWYSRDCIWSYFHDSVTQHTSLMFCFDNWSRRSNKQQSTAGHNWRCNTICISIQPTAIKYLPGDCLSVWAALWEWWAVRLDLISESLYWTWNLITCNKGTYVINSILYRKHYL